MDVYNNFSLENINGEIWMPLYFNKNYEVSNYGRVKIYCKDLKRSKTYPRIAKSQLNRFGYLWYGLINGDDKKKKTWFAHRLVAITFIQNPENKSQVNHKNGIKTDNRVENLEWCTPLENTRHSNENGLVNIKGENNISNKLSNNQVLEIFNSKEPSKKICKKYNVSSSIVRQIRNGRAWSSVTGKKYISKHNRINYDNPHDLYEMYFNLP